MFKHKSFLRLLLFLLLSLMPFSVAGARSSYVGIGENPLPLPSDCIGVAPAPVDLEACCLYGYIYDAALSDNSEPITGVLLHIESAHGVLDIVTGSGSASQAPYYNADLSTLPLLVTPGDRITITATYGDMRSTRAWIVQAGSQQVDLGLVSGYWAP